MVNYVDFGYEGNGNEKPRTALKSETENTSDSVLDLLDKSGIARLTEDSPPESVISSIHKFIALIANRDSVWKGVAKSELVKRLKRIKIQGATELVNKAVQTETGSNKKNGQEISFDDPEPWPDAVDGDELLNEISTLIKKYVVLPTGGYTALPLWILFSWVHDAFNISPILDFRSPTKRCGKTTGLRILSRLVPRPLTASNISTAALFRSIEHYQPTLIIDEVDTFLKFNSEIQGVLNAGHERDGAFVIRVEGDDLQPKRYCVWGPKILSGIGRRKDTLEDRSICISMKRKSPGERVEKMKPGLSDEFVELKRKAARWAEDNFDDLKTHDPEIPKGLNDRAHDNWAPLFSIAEVCGGDWPVKAREAALIFSGEDAEDDENISIMLLVDIKVNFQERNEDWVSSDELVRHLHGLEGRPWLELPRTGKPISKTGVARILKRFDIVPEQWRESGVILRGYREKNFLDAFSRYLSGTNGTQLKSTVLGEGANGTEIDFVPDGKPNNSFKNNDVPLVPLENRENAEKKEKYDGMCHLSEAERNEIAQRVMFD